MVKKNLNEMSFLDHLEELRWLLVRSTVAVLIFATVTFFVSDYIFEPSRKEIIESLIPKSIKTQVYKAVLDSIASEDKKEGN